MKRVYLVWVRFMGDTEDRIRGMALNYLRAEKMAEQVAFLLKSFHKVEFSYGVKSYEHGNIPANAMIEDGCFDRWHSDSFEEQDDDSYLW